MREIVNKHSVTNQNRAWNAHRTTEEKSKVALDVQRVFSRSGIV